MMSRDRCDMFCWLVIINFFPLPVGGGRFAGRDVGWTPIFTGSRSMLSDIPCNLPEKRFSACRQALQKFFWTERPRALDFVFLPKRERLGG